MPKRGTLEHRFMRWTSTLILIGHYFRTAWNSDKNSQKLHSNAVGLWDVQAGPMKDWLTNKLAEMPTSLMHALFEIYGCMVITLKNSIFPDKSFDGFPWTQFYMPSFLHSLVDQTPLQPIAEAYLLEGFLSLELPAGNQRVFPPTYLEVFKTQRTAFDT